ncbi:MAG: Ig-like domain-containing protein, partial [Gammaproteobacteria bacterium]
QATCTIVVVNNLPAAKDFTRVVIEGNAIDIGIRDELLVDCPGGTPCIPVFGDLPATITVDPASAINGSVTVLDAAAGLVRFQSTTPDSGQFTYDLVDVDGDASQGTVSVTVTTALVALDDSFNVDADSTEFPSSNDLDVTVNDGGGVAPLNVTANTPPPNGNVTFSGNVATYTPDLGFVGTDAFDYTVADSSPTPQSDTATVTITVNATTLFATDVQGALSSCIGCHSTGGFPGAPDWTDYATVTGPSIFPPNPDLIEPPAQAENSLFLQVPLTGTNLDGSPHSGGTPFSDTTDSRYRTLLRWIEEGARDN